MTHEMLSLVASLISVVVTIGGGAGFVLVTRSRVERVEKDVETLQRDKASKEALDGLRGILTDLRSHMDQQFTLLREELRRRDEGGGGK